MLARRQWLAALPALGLAGCGFHPLYATRGNRGSPAQKGLNEVTVAIIPNRVGQLLRQALQRRIDNGSGEQKLYELSVVYGIASEAINIQQDSTFTRLRLNATATWTLRSLGSPPTVLASGLSRVLDGANVIDQQYFAADIETETAQARIAESVADQITTQLAAYFVRRDSAA